MSTAPRPDLSAIEVFVGATYWALNGVNVFSANLVQGLRAKGLDAKILLSEETSALVSTTEGAMPRQDGLPFVDLPVHRLTGWGGHWGGMIAFLEQRAPCIWLPNSDYRHSGVTPRLSDDVMVVGVVHSDDPLHYDHASRLGHVWNWATATSPTIAARVLDASDALAGRLTTIPIGVDVPEAMPPKSCHPGAPLRLIYHGVLKKYQKRILDLVSVVRRCADRGIPVELTIAGGGPDENELRHAAADLVTDGLIHFLGIVPHHEIFGLLEEHDAFILTSQFEGMPNAMLEAMGRGCVPLVTRMDSGIPDLIRHDTNGFVVPIADFDAFADCIKLLQGDLDRRRAMGRAAYETVNAGAYLLENMVDGYVGVFERVLADRASGRFVRPSGPMSPPPDVVDGVSVFPVPMNFEVPGVGRFPRASDFRDFERELAHGAPVARGTETSSRWRPWPRRRRRSDDLEVIVGTRSWTASGLNEWAGSLVRGLQDEGTDARVLVTEGHTSLVTVDAPPIAGFDDVPVDPLPVSEHASWGAHWGALIAYLEGRSRPCVYLPNDDYRHSCISPVLSPRVMVIGVLHSDHALYHEHVSRLGRYWNAVVAGNTDIEDCVLLRDEELSSRLVTIPHGLDIPAQLPDRPCDGRPVKVLWLEPPDGSALLAGATSDDSLRGDLEMVMLDRHDTDRAHLLRELALGDAFVLRGGTYDDIPFIREGMGRGCIPILIDAADPAAMPVRDGHDGFLLNSSDADALGGCLGVLGSKGGALEELRREAHAAARKGSFRRDDMVAAYRDLFARVAREAATGSYQRPHGVVQPPPAQIAGIDVFPVELACDRPGVGPFIDASEAADFARALPRRHALRRPALGSRR